MDNFLFNMLPENLAELYGGFRHQEEQPENDEPINQSFIRIEFFELFFITIITVIFHSFYSIL